jgi:hypothetical protein
MKARNSARATPCLCRYSLSRPASTNSAQVTGARLPRACSRMTGRYRRPRAHDVRVVDQGASAGYCPPGRATPATCQCAATAPMVPPRPWRRATPRLVTGPSATPYWSLWSSPATRHRRGRARPPAMTAKQIRRARNLLTRPDNTVSSIARLLGVSCATIYRYVPEVSAGAKPPPCRPGRSSNRASRPPRITCDGKRELTM